MSYEVPAHEAQIEKIKAALAQPLPGWPGQKLMAPESRINGNDRRMLVQENHREGGVLILLYPDADQTLNFVLIRRPEYEGVHSGQIALPGGSREPDETLAETARRETYEEIGVPFTDITLLGTLSPVYIPPSNFMVYPFVGYYPTATSYKPDRREVAEVIDVPLALLLDEGIRRTELWDHPRLGLTDIPFFDIYGHKVWGATAMMLSEFSEILATHIERLA